MVGNRREFRCDVITPDGNVFSGALTAARFPAEDGLVGVLGGRAPLVMLLGSGPLTIRQAGGEEDVYFVAGGFARFQNNALTILAEQCQDIEDIDPQEVLKDIAMAKDLPRATPEQQECRDEAVAAARKKFNTAQRYRQ